MDDVLASGYVIAQIAMMPNDHIGTVKHDMTMALARYRAGFAAHFVDLMPKPVGAIAVAFIGGRYVLMSGAPVSALRAFGMAMLVVLAVLHDRMALTLRNLCLVAFTILAFNPTALFTVSFQPSFVATEILVIWYESRARLEPVKWHWTLRYPMALITMSCLSAMATAPFATQHLAQLPHWALSLILLAYRLSAFGSRQRA